MGILKLFYRSRLNRRIILLFIICSIVPLSFLSLLSYRQVIKHLNDQNFQLLQQTTKTISMSVYERLLFLQTEMNLLQTVETGVTSSQYTKDVATGTALTVSDRFIGIKRVDPDGRWHHHLGKIEPRPELPQVDTAKKRFDKYQPYIFSEETASGRTRLFMAVPADPAGWRSGMYVGEISPGYLWGFGEMNDLPFATELCVMEPGGRILFTTIGRPDPLIDIVIKQHMSGALRKFTWNSEDGGYLASSRALFLEGRFTVDNWIFTLSKSDEEILGAVRYFRSVFPAVIILSILLVSLLTIRVVNKSMKPLQELKRGTQEIAKGNFNTTMAVDSGDEFENLADAFNQMTQRLALQFNELKLVAEIGRKAGSISDIDRFLKASLQSMLYWLKVTRGLVFLYDKEKQRYILTYGQGFEEKTIEPLKSDGIEVTLADCHNPIRVKRVGQDKVSLKGARNLNYPSKNNLIRLATLFETAASVVITPVVYETDILGLLVLESPNGGRALVEDNRDLLSGIASQIAVSVAGITSLHHLEESERRFRRVFDNAASGIALLDLDGTFIRSNRYLTSMLGYAEDNLFKMRLQDLSHPDDIDIGGDFQRAMLKNTSAYDLHEKRLCHKNGRTLWALISISLLKDAKEEPLYFVVLVQDLTESKEAQKQRETLEQRLQQAHKMEAIGTLAGGIAHDFNNILTAIMGFTEVGLLRYKGDASIRETFEEIYTASSRAADLVRQILTFSRQQSQERKPVQVSIIVKEVIKFIRATLPASIEIKPVISEADGLILADATQIHQIILNLCTNAHHAMPPGGGRITISLEQEMLGDNMLANEPSLKAGQYIKLTVADTGSGMDEATLARIFEPYYTTKEKGKGTGLGLAVVHGIIKSHNGMIQVESEPGTGTRFMVYLPRIYLKSKAKSKPVKPVQIGSEHIVIIDDEPAILQIGKQLLSHIGYQVTIFEDPMEALQLIISDQLQPDLVVTDLTMPGISGDQLALKLHQFQPDLPIVLCTGYRESMTVEKAKALGIQSLLMKPFTLASLTKTVEDALAGTVANSPQHMVGHT